MVTKGQENQLIQCVFPHFVIRQRAAYIASKSKKVGRTCAYVGCKDKEIAV